MPFWCILSGICSLCPRQKNVEFSAQSDLGALKILLGNSKYSVTVVGLVSFYCIVMQAIWCFKFWKATKYWGTICISALPLQILQDPSHPHDLCPSCTSADQSIHLTFHRHWLGKWAPSISRKAKRFYFNTTFIDMGKESWAEQI